MVAKSSEESFQTNRELFREMLDNQKHMLSEQTRTNIELIKQANKIEGLSSDNEKNKQFIQDMKMLQSKMTGIWIAISAFGAIVGVILKETWHKIFP